MRTYNVPSLTSDIGSFRKTAITATLRKSRMFAALSAADIETIAEGCTVRSLEKGETLFREGEKATGFYVAQTGRISIYRVTPDGREQIICVFQPPESFAEVTLATVESYPANAAALEASQVILISKTHFRELVCRKPELALHMLASMSLHLKHLVQSLHDIKGRQIEGRLAEWLLQQTAGIAGTDKSSFELPVSKKNLAGQLGVTSETLSRTFARFRKEELIRVDGPTIDIIDQAGLRAYTNE
jgi:CRP/FNR family transcriptional regulator, dissimilatory nitrate respiration regulator